MTSTELDSLNRESDEQAAERLRACNASPRWIAQVLTGRPYSDVDSLLDTAERAARALDWAEVQQALDAHPRIGERADGASTEAQWSRREQSAVGTSDAATQDALRPATRRTSAASATSSSSAPRAAAPRRWPPSWIDGSPTTTPTSAPR